MFAANVWCKYLHQIYITNIYIIILFRKCYIFETTLKQFHNYILHDHFFRESLKYYKVNKSQIHFINI
jgi:hypothetical protein